MIDHKKPGHTKAGEQKGSKPPVKPATKPTDKPKPATKK
ncbi:hypothetical protein Pla144_35040 [Bythopirellula polymerisocia]|uniref:Uncharacterized protein n=1 Tax=Bythopirellula polymerisocia TaxID=2528003 RepID=A0A5C6CPE8_9BACT|nr:hypothetical protein Pla144_35040 [Bythopirellula polymerisocia]